PQSDHPRDLPSFPTRRSSDLTNTRAGHTATNAAGGRWRVAGRGGWAATSTSFQLFITADTNQHSDRIDSRESCTRESTRQRRFRDRKSTRLNSSHVKISYAVF